MTFEWVKFDSRVITVVPMKASLEERLGQLIDANLVAWSGRRLSASVAKVPLQGRKTVADLLLEDRE